MQTPFETYFENLRGKEVAVLGLGVSNRPLVRLLLEFGCIVSGGDRTERDKLDEEVLELEKQGCKLYLGEKFYEDMKAQVAFRTPGMHPDSPAVQALMMNLPPLLTFTSKAWLCMSHQLYRQQMDLQADILL